MSPTRREFMQTSLAAAVAVPAVLSASSKPSETLVIGLIGCKGMGWADLKDFLDEPNVRCAALCDIDDKYLNERAENVQEKQGKKPKLYKDYRKFLKRKDLDAVIVGTPDHWHCLPTVEACEAGKDVYVEKPLANTIEECDVMLRAARRYNRVVTVGMQQRSGKHWQEAIQFVRDGNLGKIRQVKFWANFNYGGGSPAIPDEPVPGGVDYEMWLGPAPNRPFNQKRFHGSWRMFWDYGGGLQTDWGVHLIDMGIWGMNIQAPPKSTRATGGNFASYSNATEMSDTQNVLYEFDDFTMICEHNAGIQSGPWGRNYGVAFLGTNGTLIADRDNWEVIGEGWGDDKRMVDVPQQKSDKMSHVNHVRNFIQCVKTRKKPACDIEIARLAALYAHLGNIAYRTGDVIVWDDANRSFVNNPKADKLAMAHYRKPWSLPTLS